MSKRKLDDDDEAVAEAELAAAIAAATGAAPDAAIAGLGPSAAPLFFRVRPRGAPPPQYAARPAPGEPPLVLTYFAIRGLGETVRLLLAEAAVPHDHLAVVGGEPMALAAEWRKRSPNGLLPTVSGLGVPRAAPASQSASVVRFLARRFGLDRPADGAAGALAADTLFETAKDLGAHKDAIAAPPPAAERGGAKGPWALAARLEALLEAAPAAGDDAAALDYGQLQLLQTLLALDERAPGCVRALSPALDRFRAAAAARPRVRAYLASPMRFPATCADLGREGGYAYADGPVARGALMPRGADGALVEFPVAD